MKAPIIQIVNKLKAEGKVDINDFLLFASDKEKETVEKAGLGSSAPADASKSKSPAEIAKEK
jgi:hypothetical protein